MSEFKREINPKIEGNKHKYKRNFFLETRFTETPNLDKNGDVERNRYIKKIDSVIIQIQKEFISFSNKSYSEDFLSGEEKEYILSCESLIISYLKKIQLKIEAGCMSPWKKSGDVRVSIFSGTCDYPTMAHLLLMLDNLADSEVSSDFLVLFLEPDFNNKLNKINDFDVRERLMKILTEPFCDLIRYLNYGRDKNYCEVISELIQNDYPEASQWNQIMGYDVFRKFKNKLRKDIESWNEILNRSISSNKNLKFDYYIYNRGEKSLFIDKEELDRFISESKINVFIRTSPTDNLFQKKATKISDFSSATALKNARFRVSYPSIMNVLYAGFQLKLK